MAAEGKADAEFVSFVMASVKRGFSVPVDIYGQSGHGHRKIAFPVAQTGPDFPVFLKAFLERQGYQVREYPHQTMREVFKILEAYPDSDPTKAQILAQISQMSTLELTALLSELRKLRDKF